MSQFIKLFFCSLFLIVFSNYSFAQDTVLMRDGSSKQGKVRIDYNLNDDKIVFEGILERVSAEEISTIELENGEILYAKEVSYYNKKTSSDIKKSGFFSLVLNGPAKLYKYNGQGFSFMLEVDNQNFALQEFKVKAKSSLNGFKEVLMINIVQCVGQQDIFNSKLTENSLLYLINRYNKCKDSDYIPLKKAKKKTDIKSFGFSLGQHSSSLDLNTPIYSFQFSSLRVRINNVGEVITEGSRSTELEVNLYYIDNISNSEKWFLFVNYGYRGYNFEIASEGRSASNLMASETSLTIGPSYRLPIGKKSFLQMSVGPHLWVKSSIKNERVLYRQDDENFDIVPYSSQKSNGFGIDMSIDYTFKVGENAEFFVGSKYFIRDGKNRITENYEQSIFTLPASAYLFNEISNSIYSDELTNYFSVFGGYRFVINKKGFF